MTTAGLKEMFEWGSAGQAPRDIAIWLLSQPEFPTHVSMDDTLVPALPQHPAHWVRAACKRMCERGIGTYYKRKQSSSYATFTPEGRQLLIDAVKKAGMKLPAQAEKKLPEKGGSGSIKDHVENAKANLAAALGVSKDAIDISVRF